MKAEGIDGLSWAGARELRASESIQLLRSIVDDEACRHGERVTLDVFASGDNAVVPRFFALHVEPAAEGVNAFAQPMEVEATVLSSKWFTGTIMRAPAAGKRTAQTRRLFVTACISG